MLRTIRRTELLHQKHSIVGAPPPPVWQLPSPGLWLPWRFLKQFKIFGLVLGNRSCTLMVAFFSSSSNWARLHTGLSLGPLKPADPPSTGAVCTTCCVLLRFRQRRVGGMTHQSWALSSSASPVHLSAFWHLGTLTNVIPSSPSGDGVFPGPSRRVSRLYLQVANRQE